MSLGYAVRVTPSFGCENIYYEDLDWDDIKWQPEATAAGSVTSRTWGEANKIRTVQASPEL
jgi:hypothetical protein